MLENEPDLAAPVARQATSASGSGKFLAALIVLGIVFVAAFVIAGFLNLPTGSAQRVAVYYGTRLIPLGILLMLIETAVALALATARAFAPTGIADAEPVVGPAMADPGRRRAQAERRFTLRGIPLRAGLASSILGAVLLLGSSLPK